MLIMSFIFIHNCLKTIKKLKHDNEILKKSVLSLKRKIENQIKTIEYKCHIINDLEGYISCDNEKTKKDIQELTVTNDNLKKKLQQDVIIIKNLCEVLKKNKS